MASEHAQLKDELEAVRQDNIQLVREHNHVKQACEELRRLHEDDQREVADMRMLHQQVTVELDISSTFMLIQLHTGAHCLCIHTLEFNHLDLDTNQFPYLLVTITSQTSVREMGSDKLVFIVHNNLSNEIND